MTSGQKTYIPPWSNHHWTTHPGAEAVNSKTRVTTGPTSWWSRRLDWRFCKVPSTLKSSWSMNLWVVAWNTSHGTNIFDLCSSLSSPPRALYHLEYNFVSLLESKVGLHHYQIPTGFWSVLLWSNPVLLSFFKRNKRVNCPQWYSDIFLKVQKK